MKSRSFYLRYLAAGSAATVIVLLALVPFNMGGCGPLDISTISSGVMQMGKGVTRNEEGDNALGQAVAVQVTSKYPLYRDQDLNRYVTLVGRTVASASPRADLDFYFAVVDTDEVNAFSGPGGYVMITRGTLKRIKNEAELAGVLGHEIGHICKHHGRDAAAQADIKAGALKVLSGASQQAQQFSATSDFLGQKVLDVGFGEPQEIEADGEGWKYAAAAGYDPAAYLTLLKRLKDEQGAGGKPFSTHPGIGDRIKKVEEDMNKAGAGGQGVLLAERFQTYVVLP